MFHRSNRAGGVRGGQGRLNSSEFVPLTFKVHSNGMLWCLVTRRSSERITLVRNSLLARLVLTPTGHCLFTANKRAFNNSNPNALWYLKDEGSLAKERRHTTEVLAREGVLNTDCVYDVYQNN